MVNRYSENGPLRVTLTHTETKKISAINDRIQDYTCYVYLCMTCGPDRFRMFFISPPLQSQCTDHMFNGRAITVAHLHPSDYSLPCCLSFVTALELKFSVCLRKQKDLAYLSFQILF